MEDHVKEACDAALDMMLKMNPDREHSHGACDWAIENFMDMVYDYMEEIPEDTLEDIIYYWDDNKN